MGNELILNCAEIIFEGGKDIAPELFEVGIDQLFEDGFLKDLPIVGTAVKAGCVVSKIVGVFNTKHILVFASSINNGEANRKINDKHLEELQKSPKKKMHELEVLVASLLKHDKYIKDQILANFYLLYCAKELSWKDFDLLRKMTEDFYPYDWELLKKIYCKRIIKNEHYDSLAMRRLNSIGCVEYFGGTEVMERNRSSKISYRAKINNVGILFWEKGLSNLKMCRQVDDEQRIL